MNKEEKILFMSLSVFICQNLLLNIISIAGIIVYFIRNKKCLVNKNNMLKGSGYCLLIFLANLILNSDLEYLNFIYFFIFILIIEMFKKRVKTENFCSLYLLIIIMKEVMRLWENL